MKIARFGLFAAGAAALILVAFLAPHKSFTQWLPVALFTVFSITALRIALKGTSAARDIALGYLVVVFVIISVLLQPGPNWMLALITFFLAVIFLSTFLSTVRLPNTPEQKVSPQDHYPPWVLVVALLAPVPVALTAIIMADPSDKGAFPPLIALLLLIVAVLFVCAYLARRGNARDALLFSILAWVASLGMLPMALLSRNVNTPRLFVALGVTVAFCAALLAVRPYWKRTLREIKTKSEG
jgi:hypothetical protein